MESFRDQWKCYVCRFPIPSLQHQLYVFISTSLRKVLLKTFYFQTMDPTCLRFSITAVLPMLNLPPPHLYFSPPMQSGSPSSRSRSVKYVDHFKIFLSHFSLALGSVNSAWWMWSRGSDIPLQLFCRPPLRPPLGNCPFDLLYIK